MMRSAKRINKQQQQLTYNDRSLLTKKSLANLFKLVAIVAFIKYELIHQQQVAAGRSRGLIYNKDGKFIYRPPKSGQGHIIVIDDRHREANRIAELPRIQAAASPAETVYQPVRLISQRVYHSGAAQLAPPIRGYYPGEQVQLINLNNLQGVVQSPAALGQQATIGADSRPIRQQTLLQNPAAIQALRQPLGPVSLPVIQVYQPGLGGNRPSELATYANYQPTLAQPLHQHQTQVLGQQAANADYANLPVQASNQQQFELHYAPQDQRELNSYASPPVARAYEADTPVGSYDLPMVGIDHQADNSLFDENSSPYGPLRLSEQMNKQLGPASMQEFDDVMNAANGGGDPFATIDQQTRALAQLRGPSPRLRHDKPADRDPNQLLPLKRLKLINEGALPVSSAQRNFKRNSDSKAKQKDANRMAADSLTDQSFIESSNPKGIEGKNSRYWAQFKDQFDFVH